MGEVIKKIVQGFRNRPQWFLAGTFCSSILYSETPGQSAVYIDFVWFQGTMMLGLGDAILAFIGWSQLFQIVVPVLLAWAMIRAAGRREQSVVTA